jgi:HEAT repeat protein
MQTTRVAALLLGAALAAGAQSQPAISNAKLIPGSAAQGLEGAIRSAVAREAGPLWIGYAVPAMPGDRQSCCWSDFGHGCGLEGRAATAPSAPSGPVKLEGPTHISVLLRAEGGEIRKLRSFTADCPLDAGGLAMIWLADAAPAQSLAYLEKFAASDQRSLADGAVHAIGMHAGDAATQSLQRLAQSGKPDSVRKNAIFWLANARGRTGFEIVRRAAREDASDKVREHAIFALTQSKEKEAVPEIIRIAREDKSPRVRSQALFWLGQKASRQASAAITEAIESDPDTEVKKKAVFALSQLPKDEGVPRLIEVAKSNSNPAVRKQAMFWLGQSKDPRALAFFEQVLAK